MAKKLLRSGSLKDFLAAGSNGRSVFHSALQIREALRLRGLSHAANCLAIPQSNEEFARVDWYAPIEGKVITWAAADEKLQQQALGILEQQLAAVNLLSQQCQQSEKSAVRLFGSLLCRTFLFPGTNCIFLIDDKPVITCWGFTKPGATMQEDLLADLRPPEIKEEDVKEKTGKTDEPQQEAVSPSTEPQTEEMPSAMQAQPVSAVNDSVPPSLPVPEFIPPDSNEPDTVVTIQKKTLSGRLWRITSAIILLLLAGGFILWQYFSDKAPSARQTANMSPESSQRLAHAQPSSAENEHTFANANKTAEADAPQQQQNDILKLNGNNTSLLCTLHDRFKDDTRFSFPEILFSKLNLPLQQAQFQPPPVSSAPVVTDKNALVMPDIALKTGSTRFLNGRWLVQPIQEWEHSDRRLRSLRYQIKDNKGTVRITYDDNIECQAAIYTGLMPSGTLMLKSRARASCNNKTRRDIPTIACKQGENSQAECSGYYNEKEIYPLTFKKVNS